MAIVAIALGAVPVRAQAPGPVTVPFTLLPSRHMVVEATLNGKGPYRFVFDTGAPLTLIDGKVADAAGLPAGLGGGLGMLLGGPAEAKLKTLAVGGVVAKNVPVVVMDHPTVRSISDAFPGTGGPLRGIIGFPFFARYRTTIDYQKQQLVLSPNGFEPGDFLQDLMARLTAAADAGAKPRVVAPAGLWGVTVGKPAGDTNPGVVVAAVAAGGPADKAGLRVGDRVLTVDGRWTDTVADAYLAASLVKPGRTVAVVIQRAREEVTVNVTPANGL